MRVATIAMLAVLLCGCGPSDSPDGIDAGQSSHFGSPCDDHADCSAPAEWCAPNGTCAYCARRAHCTGTGATWCSNENPEAPRYGECVDCYKDEHCSCTDDTEEGYCKREEPDNSCQCRRKTP